MSNLSRKMMMGAGGGISGSGEYIEDIFSTWLYTGTGNEQFIPNQINLGDTVTTYLTGKPLTNLSDVDSGYPVSALADGILEVSNAQSIFYTSGILDVYVDMGSPVVVTQYLIAPQGDINANTYNNITGFNVKASNDASSWTTVTTFSSIVTGIPAWNPGSFRPFVFSNSTAYRYWRIEATSNGASISEWALGVNTPGSGEGGMVWIKGRSVAYGNYLFDTARGTNKELISNNTNAQSTITDGLNSFNSSGFSLGSRAQVNQSPDTYASWAFRKAPGFFDVVTYTGDGTVGRTVAHNLGSVPGCIIVKNITDAGEGWIVGHRSLETGSYLQLNNTAAAAGGGSSIWNNTLPTSNVFTVGGSNSVNRNGATYVAYLFAHDEQIFGEGGDQSVIKCGSFTGSGPQTVNLGWEPQWILRKRTDLTGNWQLEDTMRGIVVGGNEAQLQPNLSNAEASTSDDITLTSTGFNTTANVNGTWIYIAIRRGPMKTPTDATKVFSSLAITTSVQTTGTVRTTGFPVDMMLSTARTITLDKYISTKLLGGFPSSNISCPNLRTSSAAVESSSSSMAYDAWNTTIKDGSFYGVDSIRYFFRRAPGFFDVVAYTGNNTAGRTISHNLGVTPELMIVKARSAAQSWRVYTAATGATKSLLLNSTLGVQTTSGTWNNTSPTSTVFTVSTFETNENATYIAYLFASCPGVSKVGSYTGTGTTLQINCGFTAGARFVLIKRTDSTGDWYVWDTARGIVSGNDPYLLLNSTAAEVTNTDFIDPLNSGFEISSTATAEINASGGTFVFLAIA